MSANYKHSIPVYSDESNSTEHDVTVSLSGTDEFNDTHSIFSETGSKASRLNDSRKGLQKINKLKEENAMLKESLEKANASDITMLKSKLRGSHADLVRLRQNNSELKDRIQILEGRLFSALSMASTSSKVNSSVITADERDLMDIFPVEPDSLPTHFTENPQKEKFSTGDRAHLMDMIRSLQSRCKHLARLVQSYETKISILQTEVDKKQQPLHQLNNEHKIEFDQKYDDQSNSSAINKEGKWSNPLKSALKGRPGSSQSLNIGTVKPDLKPAVVKSTKVKVQMEEMEARIQQAREEDLKMIQELSSEVRRLVSLLPRDKVDPESVDELNGGLDESTPIPETPLSNTDNERSAGKVDMSFNYGTKYSKYNRSVEHRYGHGDVMCSFFLGITVMLLSVAITTYFGHFT
jgi:hypothetical protein